MSEKHWCRGLWRCIGECDPFKKTGVLTGFVYILDMPRLSFVHLVPRIVKMSSHFDTIDTPSKQEKGMTN